LRGSWSIVKVTALEVLSEPLTLLVTLSALVLAVLAPAFHYHQFGEATRMARDAGFSAVLVGGGVVSVFGTIRAFRREVESGTLEMALARPVSRNAFFLSKALGAFLAASAVCAVVFATSLAIVAGAAVGGRLAERSGDVARIWGPCVAAGVVVIVFPLVIGAVLNRFGGRRFVLTAMTAAVALSVPVAAFALFRETSTLAPLLTGALPLCFLMALLVSAAAAFSFRFRANAAAALTGCVVAGLLPFAGNYYLADALANGGIVAGSYVALSAAALAPAVAAFLLLGCGGGEDASRRE